MRSLFHFIYTYWQGRPLRYRILLPIIVLMILSLLASAAAFLVGTARTEKKILENQLHSDYQRTEETLLDRALLVGTAANLLSSDPQLITALEADDLLTINNRALVIRDRFFLDLVQVFDAEGIERANLVTADLYQVSSLLNNEQQGDMDVQVVDDRLLLLSQHGLPDGRGTVITGIDLESELIRIVSQERLPSEVSLRSQDSEQTVTSNAAFDPNQDRTDLLSSLQDTVVLGNTSLDLIVSQQNTDIRTVTGAGFTVMVASSVLTTVLLLFVGIFITRSITGPIQKLATTATSIAGGDWSYQQELTDLVGGQKKSIQSQDEIQQLAHAFDVMLGELRSLYTSLEHKVAERTRWLLTAAEVAQAASSSLDLDVVLTASVERIQDSYGFAQVSVYVMEPDTRVLSLSKTFGLARFANLTRVARLEAGYHSLVGAAAAEMAPLVVQDVAMSQYYRSVPELPTTRSEAVFPLISGETLAGVLDVQSASLNAFSEETVSSLRTIADQLAVAIQNARLYDAAQREVEERRRAEEARRLSQERYRLLFEEDLTGDFIAREDGSVIACNAAFARIFDFDSVPQAGRCQLPDLFESPGEWRDLVSLVKQHGRLEYYETELHSCDGNTVSVIANLVGTQDEGGNLHELKGYLFDNTERKRLEDQLRHSQKMEAIGRLAGGVAHDFNNLLTVVMGYSELLSLRKDLDPQVQKQITTIHQTAQRAATLTSHLLAFSRKQVMQPKTLNLNTVMADMESMIQRMIGEDVCLSMRLAPDIGSVKADPTQIEQVVMNLIVNARDAMPSGGQLIIETTNVFLDDAYAHNHVEVQPGRYVMLAVSDTGSGIPVEVLPYIFEPFYTTKEVGRGTGLGLSTVYGILKQSDGHIRVYSEVGQGTTFKIYLPRTDEDAKREITTLVNGTLTRGGETLLLVEDEETVREMTASILRACGYNVLEAAHGMEALDIVGTCECNIHLLITDVIMPGMNGKEVVDRLRGELPDLGVLYISGYTEEAVAQHGVLSPDAAFMSKPFSPATLTSKVREILDADNINARWVTEAFEG